LEIIRRLLEGETVNFKGKYYEVNQARLAPLPVQQPRLPIWTGDFTPPGTQRAAKYADGFMAVGGPSKELFDSYVTALQALGKPTTHLRQLGILNVVDVDTCIAMIRAFASAVPLTHYYSFTFPPGLPASWVQPHLELFASKVIPAFR
jgi:hypothetical protein